MFALSLFYDTVLRGKTWHFRALDEREYLVIIRDNFCCFCIKIYVVTPHLNRLDEMVQMRGHNI